MGIFCFANPKKEIFNGLYHNINGYNISRIARNKLSDEENEHLIYGEIEYDGLEKLYKRKKLNEKINSSKIFYDLGSGSGKIILASELLLPNIKKFIGIELLKELFDISNEVKDKLIIKNKINFINENFFNINLQDADIIFLHFPIKNSEKSYIELENKFIKELKTGTLIISGIRKLFNIQKFPLIDKIKAQSSYGKTILFCHIKL